MKRRVVITGIGAVTPIGNNVADFWKNVQANVCGIDFITQYDTSDRKVKVAAEVKNLDVEAFLDKKAARHMDRFSQLGLIAALEAYRDAQLEEAEFDRDRFGVIVSSGIGGLGTIEREHSKALASSYDRVTPYFIPMVIGNLGAGNIAIALQAYGMCTSAVTACASGTNAIGDGFRQIRDGYLDVVAVGGTESTITPLAIGGFTSMKALTTSTDPLRASMPFDAERSGFVMGEGAGILILEEYEHARKRHAKIYAEVVGYGSTCDAYHITAPSVDGSGAAKAMGQAIQDANIRPEEVDYINAHGTSTPMNDAGETMAIKLAFGSHSKDVAVSSTKSMIGHLLGASGAVEAIAVTLALKEGFLPANIGYQVPDKACDLNLVVNEGRPADLRYAMSNSLGFGGHNASIILKKIDEAGE